MHVEISNPDSDKDPSSILRQVKIWTHPMITYVTSNFHKVWIKLHKWCLENAFKGVVCKMASI